MSRHACWIQWDGRDQQLTCENTALRGWAREGGLTWQNETGWHAKRQGLPSVCNILSIIWYWLPWNLLTAWKWFWQTFELESALCFLFFFKFWLKQHVLIAKHHFLMTSWPQEPQLKNPKQFQGGNMQRVAQTFSTKFEVSISLAGGRQSGPKSKLFFFAPPVYG